MHADILILDFEPSVSQGYTFLLVRPPSLWYLVTGQPQEINIGPYTDSEGEAERLSSARLSEMPWRKGEAEVSRSAKGQQFRVNSLSLGWDPKSHFQGMRMNHK